MNDYQSTITRQQGEIRMLRRAERDTARHGHFMFAVGCFTGATLTWFLAQWALH